MNNIRNISLVVLLCIFCMATGCTDVSSPPLPEPTVTSLPTQNPEKTPEPFVSPVLTLNPTPVLVPDLYAGPVIMPQKELSLVVDVVKDPIYKVITITFTGGLGQTMVKTIEVRVITPDGAVTKKNLSNKAGDEIMFQGTGGNDRVQVIAHYLNGETYKIYDQILSGYRIGENNPAITPIPTQIELSDQKQSYEPTFEGPVILPPDNLSVSIDVEKDPIFNVITTTFLGGHGQGIIGTIFIHATLSDGQEVTKKLGNSIGTISEVQGTKGSDRVEVVVFFKSGESYKIYDQVLSGRR